MAQAKAITKVPAKKAAPVAEKKVAVKKVTTPVTKKTVAAKSTIATATKKSTSAKSSVKSPVGSKKKMELSPEQRYRMIAEAAYYRAEKRGFEGGNSAQDWIEAEAEIKQLLSSAQIAH